MEGEPMKPNFYTQCVLTVIAACLLWLCVQGYVTPQPARADGPVEVVIKGVDLGPPHRSALPVDIADSGTLPVEIKGQPVEVKVRQ